MTVHPRARRDADWVACPGCGWLLYGKRLARELHVCPECGHHHRLAARERVRQLADPDSFVESGQDIVAVDPLRFEDRRRYVDRLGEAASGTGEREAAVFGRASVEGHPVVLLAMDFAFLGGSMGYAVGEAVTRAAELAHRTRHPLVLVCASGGARMQEGVGSLLQMAKTSQAMARLHEAGVLSVCVLTDPTYGGVTASFATLGSVLVAESGATVGFAGPRVIAQTIREDVPEGFQSSDFLLRHGLVDRVETRAGLRPLIARLIDLHATPDRAGDDAAGPVVHVRRRAPVPGDAHGHPHPTAPDAAHGHPDRPAHDTAQAHPHPLPRRALHGHRHPVARGAVHGPPHATGHGDGRPHSAPRPHLPRRHDGTPAARGGAAGVPAVADAPARDPWEVVRLARDLHRPTALDYLDAACEDFVELHGDRAFADDPAVVGGVARIGDRRVVVVAHQKGHDTTELVARNFGMPHPEGYRKAARLMRHAERLGLPVVTLVDTPGAYPGVDAERRGQALAIAETIMQSSRLRVPVVSVVTGEGGSGGALALATGDRLLVLENAFLSVISPEGCAAILWRTAAAAPDAARSLRLTAADLLALGVADAVVPEPPGGAHTDPGAAAAALRAAVAAALDDVADLPAAARLDARYRRFRGVGAAAAPPAFTAEEYRS